MLIELAPCELGIQLNQSKQNNVQCFTRTLIAMKHLSILRIANHWRLCQATCLRLHGTFRAPLNINRTKFTSTATGLTDTHRLLIDSIKKRQPKKKLNVSGEIRGLCERSVVALSTAEEYNLESVREAITQQGLYNVVDLPCDNNELEGDVLHLTANYEVQQRSRQLFIFREGSIVFWNMLQSECELILKLLKEHEIGSYENETVNDEKEEIDVVYENGSASKFQKGLIYLNEENEASIVNLEKYSFSNAIALSVKLSIWEANLDGYIESIAYITQDMKEGKKIKLTRDQVFRKTGQLFGLRHRINLSSDLLDTPDFYWDREDLEKLFQATHSYLNINKRTKVMNEKLNHCIELMDLLSAHLNDNHHVRLEWMIIVLIMIEVFFEILHFMERL